MRVLMIQALSVEEPSREKVYPIGIVSLAGRLLEAGHQVDIIDMNIQADPFGALKEKLLDFSPGVVALSLRNVDPLGNKTNSLIPPFAVTLRLISAISPPARIIVGGAGFSLFPRRLMQEFGEIHFGIIGEAENSLPALVSSLDSPPSLKGLCLRKGPGEILATPPDRGFDMSRYLPPPRRLLDPSLYLECNSYVQPIGIEAKRGCPFGCVYCVYPGLQGKRLRCRRPGDVVDEIEVLWKEHGVGRFHFTDPVLNIPAGFLEDICREILRRGLRVRWSGFFREDRIDHRNIGLFERAGCECFSFSPDGLCQEALDALGKGMELENILKASALAAESGVLSVYHFMVNVPGENEDTVRKGVRLLDRLYQLHARKKSLGTVVFNNIRILPGTPMELLARSQGITSPGSDLLYPVYYNPGPFDTLRYRMETLHLQKNVFMWQEVR